MNQWEIAAAVLTVALVPCLAICLRCGVMSGLAALELGSVLLTTILLVLCEGLQRQPFVDLALVFAILSLGGGLVFARMLERDL